MNQASLFCLRIIKIMTATISKWRQYIFVLSRHYLTILNNFVCSTGQHKPRLIFLICYMYFLWYIYVGTVRHSTKRPEDNLWESVPNSHHVELESDRRCSGLVAPTEPSHKPIRALWSLWLGLFFFQRWYIDFVWGILTCQLQYPGRIPFRSPKHRWDRWC